MRRHRSRLGASRVLLRAIFPCVALALATLALAAVASEPLGAGPRAAAHAQVRRGGAGHCMVSPRRQVSWRAKAGGGLSGKHVSMASVIGEEMSSLQNLQALGDEHRELMETLVKHGQDHLFSNWAAPGTDDEKKTKMMDQLKKLDASYPGGLVDYIKNSRDLLEAAVSGGNALEGFVPSVPVGERLEVGSDKYKEMEAIGMTEAAHAVFVLVAGGLGERLGFEGIKVSLPSDLLSGKPFLQLYAENILSLQAKGREASNNPDLKLPLAIMTSGDTHERTIKLLEENNYFGLDADQVTLIQQEKVPAIMDRTGSIAVDPEDPYTVLTKPHGHGDVHTLLHQSGLASKWASEGRRWIMFFQDTNGLIFQAAPALIGVSESLGLQINTLTVPRRPGEAVGSICHLKHQETGQELTINVEYNQLEPLLKSTVSPEGDVPDKSGFSPYPGNTNALVFRVEPYAKVLKETGGKMPEFVNPKFKDESKTAFKKPTRLECMMQDYPRLLGRDAKVGFTQLERWSCFAAVKNNAVDAAAQHKKTGFAESASTAESAIYRMFRQKLQLLGVHVAEPTQEVFNGVPTWVGPKVILSPSFASTFEEMGRKFLAPESVQISKDSTLHLDGRDIEIKSLDLDGSLSVTAVPGARVVIDGKVKNTPWQFTPVDADDKTIPEPLRIRGYDMDKSSKDHVYVFDKPGTYTIP